MKCSCEHPVPVAPNGPPLLCLVCGGTDPALQEVRYSIDREHAKSGVTGQTLEYIEQLEEIARAAFVVWQLATILGPPSIAIRLYDALEKVDFMEEDDA